LDLGEGGVFRIVQVINDFALRGTKGRIARGLKDCKNEALEDILDAEGGHVGEDLESFADLYEVTIDIIHGVYIPLNETRRLNSRARS
jgi:hypothetical protein